MERRLREIVDELVAAGQRAVVVGDFNEGQVDEATSAANFAPLFDPQGPLGVCYGLPGFDNGPRPGTFDSCGIRNRLDYIFVTKDLVPAVTGGGIFRNGLWGSRDGLTGPFGTATTGLGLEVIAARSRSARHPAYGLGHLSRDD